MRLIVRILAKGKTPAVVHEERDARAPRSDVVPFGSFIAFETCLKNQPNQPIAPNRPPTRLEHQSHISQWLAVCSVGCFSCMFTRHMSRDGRGVRLAAHPTEGSPGTWTAACLGDSLSKLISLRPLGVRAETRAVAEPRTPVGTYGSRLLSLSGGLRDALFTAQLFRGRARRLSGN
ncbi:hypothetical protein LX36DRAFT_418235 [Colletotrichum falcatum]|nr:hypothetical protein LX36DRAFT_418235 [Colletotrichum falcatum]